MIKTESLSKRFGQIEAVRDLSLEIPEGQVFGLVGTNGAGKSTLLRLMAGILRPDQGSVSVDGERIYENAPRKAEAFYISDDAYFDDHSTPAEEAAFLKLYYPRFDLARFTALTDSCGLDRRRKIRTFSKGMKKQLSLIFGLCAGTKYMLCDETFDGLDPVMRQAAKSLIAGECMNRDFTPVIASHNLRELEDICERVGLLHQGGILLERDLVDLKIHIHKVQCVIRDQEIEKRLLEDLDAVLVRRQGSLLVLTVRGEKEDIMRRVQEAEPLFCEVLPLSLEEIFISETEVAGYEVKNILS